MRNSSKKWALINIGLCWFLGITIGFLPAFGWFDDSVKDSCFFIEKIKKSYLVFFCFVSISIPTIILVVIYIFIFIAVRKQVHDLRFSRKQSELFKLLKQIEKSKQSKIDTLAKVGEIEESVLNSQEEAIRELEKHELKATKNLTLIVVFFAICWTVSLKNCFADKILILILFPAYKYLEYFTRSQA